MLNFKAGRCVYIYPQQSSIPTAAFAIPTSWNALRGFRGCYFLTGDRLLGYTGVKEVRRYSGGSHGCPGFLEGGFWRNLNILHEVEEHKVRKKATDNYYYLL